MLTSPFIDLLTDSNFFAPTPHPRSSHPFHHPRSRPRNVRVLYVLALIGGCFLGAGVHKAGGTETVMWVSVAMRVGVMGWVGVLKGEESEEKVGCIEEGRKGGCEEKRVGEERKEESSRREEEPMEDRATSAA